MNGLEALQPLLEALKAQTESMDRLTKSNEALIQALLESEEMDEEVRTTYLDGTPIR